MTTPWAHADCDGWLLIRPYAKYYDALIAYKFSRGRLAFEDLHR